MAYIDESYLQDAFGADQVTALCPTASVAVVAMTDGAVLGVDSVA